MKMWNLMKMDRGGTWTSVYHRNSPTAIDQTSSIDQTSLDARPFSAMPYTVMIDAAMMNGVFVAAIEGYRAD